MVEEGQPEFIEQALNTILRRRDIQTKIVGQGRPAAWPANIPRQVMPKAIEGLRRTPRPTPARQCAAASGCPACSADPKVKALAEVVPPRPPGFCTGCPERPIFAAMKLVAAGTWAASRRRRHRLPSVLDPAAVQHRRDDHGLRARRRPQPPPSTSKPASADLGHGRRRLLAQRPCLPASATPSSTNMTASSWSSTIIYSAATGGQDILSSRAAQPAPHNQ